MSLNFLQSLIGSSLPGQTPGYGQGPVYGQDHAIDPNLDLPTLPINFGTASLPGLPEQPRRRNSAIDLIGRLADVAARVGGADALYEPAINARQDREIAMADHARTVDLDRLKRTLVEQQIASGGAEAANTQHALLGKVAQAAMAYPETDRARVFSLLAQQAGIPTDQVASVMQNPDMISGVSRMFTDGNLGRQVYYGRDAQGQTVAYQVGQDGQYHPLDTGGVTPVQGQTRSVDLGGGIAQVDPTSGRTVGRILPRTERPGAAEDRQQRGTIAVQTSADRRYVADQASGDRRYAVDNRPAPRGAAGGGANGKPSPVAVAAAARPLVRDLADAVTRLHRSGGMTNSLNSMARENVPGYERMTNSAGYSARQDLDRLTTQGISALLPLMGGLSLGGKNMDAAKELDTWKKAILSATDYPSAMRAINSFNARIRQMEATAPAAAPARRTGTLTAPRRTVTPASRGGGNGGWSIVSTR